MNVLIIEVYLTGHHSVYFEKIAKAHLALGRTVTILVSNKCIPAPILKQLAVQYPTSLRMITFEHLECERAFNSICGNLGRELAFWRLFNRSYRKVALEHSFDYVFLPYLDYCLNAVGLLGTPFGKTPWGGICMRPAFHLQECGAIGPRSKLLPIKKQLFLRLLSSPTLKCIFTIDELLAKYVNDLNQVHSHKIKYAPDPAEPPRKVDSLEIRKQIGIPENAMAILVYGALDERKGLDVLIDAVNKLDADSNIHLLLVGLQSNTIRKLLTSDSANMLKNKKRIFEINEFVNDTIEQEVFAACDIVWVGYREHYTMSGVLVRAGMYSKPVISCEEGLIGWYTKNKCIGIAVKQNTNSVVTAIIGLSEMKQMDIFGANCHEQFKKHTWPNFLSILFSVCDSQ